jgi:hypothetical protein
MHQEVQYGVGWGTLALINAGLAQGKNRSGLVWFLVSLLLGPIATFILLLLEKLPGRVDLREPLPRSPTIRERMSR